MTEKQALTLYERSKLQPPPELARPDASKFNARKKCLDGIMFASTLEAEAYVLLKSWERTGAIAALELQPAFELQGRFKVDGKYLRSIKYVADFRVTDKDGTVRVIEVKGVRTPVFNMKLKMFRLKFPDVILEIWNRDTLRGLL